MIYCGSLHLFTICLTLQLIMTYMANATPYVSQFKHTPEHHPSSNPNCPPTRDPRKTHKSNADKYFITKSHKNNANDDVRRNTESSVEMIASLLPCSNQVIINNHNAKSQWRRYSKINKCHRKLAIDIKLTNVGKIPTGGDQFIVIDHVIDPITMQKFWLIDPYLVKLRQEQVLELYGLQLQSVVNAEATEEVINNNNEGFLGCDDYSDHPTCGQMYYKDIKIPYSQGFCCSCDTNSPSQIHQSQTVFDVRPQFHHKRFTNGTKSIGKLLKDLHSYNRHLYSTISPWHFKAKKYLEADKIPARGWANIEKEDLPKKYKRSIEKLPTYVSANNLGENNVKDFSKFTRLKFSTLPRQKKRFNMKRTKRNKNYLLDRLGKILMNTGKNNEENVDDNEQFKVITLDVPPSTTYIVPIISDFFHENLSSTVQGQSLEMKLYDVDVEKTTRVQRLNWKKPIEGDHSFISRNEDLRDLEMQLKSLVGISKKAESTISPISDHFQIVKKTKGRSPEEIFINRKLFNYDSSKHSPAVQLPNIFTARNEDVKEHDKKPSPPRDFAIALTGKIHIDGGANGSPVSITFDTSPGGLNSNDLLEQSYGRLKVNRRSIGNMGIPYEIIPRRLYHKRGMSNKITRSDYSVSSQISEKNLISNELPPPQQMDQNGPETSIVNSDKIKPYSEENVALCRPISTKSPDNLFQLSEGTNPVNLKIIGLISMSNPGRGKIQVNSKDEKTDKGWLGDLEIAPLIHVKVEKQSSVEDSPGTNEKTTGKPSCSTSVGQTSVQSISHSFTSGLNTKSLDDIPETVTFYVDSDDEDFPSQSSYGKSTMKIMTMKNEFLLTNNDNNNNNNTIVEKPSQGRTPIAQSPGDNYPSNEADTRLNNMLAIMEFIKRLKSILTGDESFSSNEEEPATVIRLQKFVITPENSSNILEKLSDDSNYERYVNTRENSSAEISTQHPTYNINGPNESQIEPKQTYISRIIKRPKNVDDDGEIHEPLRGTLIDQYSRRKEKSDEQEKERVALEISRELASLNSKDAFENNRQLRSRKIVNSGSRLERKEVAKRDKKPGRNKKRRKKKKNRRRKQQKSKKILENRQEAKATNEKTWWPFKRQLMSFTIENVPEKIYDDEIEEKYSESIRKRRNSQNDRSKKFFSKKAEAKLHHQPRNTNSGFHIRGGQNCADFRHPQNIDPAKYLESAHCLRFSNLWYSVYKLEKPVVEHTVYIQLFKRQREQNKSSWRDLTHGKMIRLGTFTRHQGDNIPTLVFTYTAEKTNDEQFNLDPNSQRLLIPLIEEDKTYPEGMREYLIIPSNEITREGRECDKAGVGFSAFVMQKDRCARKRGSCLRNQPLSYWRHDTNARDSGQPGCYFLSNFASVPANPIKYNVTDTSEKKRYLGLVKNTQHTSTLEIEVRADDNDVIVSGPAGRITEMYADATSKERIHLSIRFTNTGLVSSDYQARIVGCPSGLPSSWANAITPRETVPPQHDLFLTLNLAGRIIIDRFNCTAEVINYRGELVAARRIIVHKMNRCFCLWHCVCTCYQSSPGFSCSPMTPEYYHRAGFRGPVPAINYRHSQFYNITIDLLLIVLLLFSLLLILGIVKWFLGIIFPQITRWGLDSLLSAAKFKIDEYLEPDLKCRCVVTDDEGIPIHPDTARRTVRICSRAQEFFINSLFFFLYPSCILCDCIRRICKCKREKCHCDDDDDDSKTEKVKKTNSCIEDNLIDKKCHRVISVRSYGDAKNSKLEREDIEYVITELKKSQVSLGH